MTGLPLNFAAVITRLLHPRILALAMAMPGLVPATAHATMTTRTINSNAAWCWFQDERALIVDNVLTMASIDSRATVEVTAYDLDSGTSSITELRGKFDRDDHNVPSMVQLGDGRLLAQYCRHHKENVMHSRHSRTSNPLDGWKEETTFTFGVDPAHRFTYSNLYRLQSEGNRVYQFWRGIHFHPTFSYSDNRGTTWSDARQLMMFELKQRPYVKYCSNGRDEIHFTYTEGHPMSTTTSIYHAWYKNGKVHRSDGSVLCTLDKTPFPVAEGTPVYSAAKSGHRAWTWDIALDTSGAPVIAYAVIEDETTHRYRYARWDEGAKTWKDHAVAPAGGALYPRERAYSGGICLDPDDVSVVYISTPLDPVTGMQKGTGKREIYCGKTTNGGATWNWRPITSNSSVENLRPVVPANHPPGAFVLWMSGSYPSYQHYDTAIRLASDTMLP